MGKVMFQMAVSLDGYVAGPDQSVENPVGVGGMRVFEWFFDLEVWRQMQGLEGGVVNASTDVIEDARSNVGAYVMGRNMFGGGPGPWPDDPPWTGWWGDEPSYHVPVFVLTHHPRDPLEMLAERPSTSSRTGSDRRSIRREKQRAIEMCGSQVERKPSVST